MLRCGWIGAPRENEGPRVGREENSSRRLTVISNVHRMSVQFNIPRVARAAVVVVFASCSTSESHSDTAAVSRADPPAKAPAAAEMRLDPTWVTIPPDFAASQPESVVKRYELDRRDEYEPTAEYAKRVQAAVDTGVVGMALPDPLQYYDPDGRRLVLRLIPVRLEPDGEGVVFGIEVVRKDTSLGSYAAANAFGAQRTVRQTRSDIIAVSRARDIDSTDVSFPLSPDSARAVSARVRWLLLVRPRQRRTGEVVTEEGKHERPTFDHPEDMVLRIRALWVSSVAVWAYDPQSGRVLAKRALR